MLPGGYQVSDVVRFDVRCLEHCQVALDAAGFDW